MELPVLLVILNVVIVQLQQILLNVLNVVMDISYLELPVRPVIVNVLCVYLDQMPIVMDVPLEIS